MSLQNYLSGETVEKVPMHPEDYTALLEWVRAKERGDPRGSSEHG